MEANRFKPIRSSVGGYFQKINQAIAAREVVHSPFEKGQQNKNITIRN